MLDPEALDLTTYALFSFDTTATRFVIQPEAAIANATVAINPANFMVLLA
jgi:hypothetical protein